MEQRYLQVSLKKRVNIPLYIHSEIIIVVLFIRNSRYNYILTIKTRSEIMSLNNEGGVSIVTERRKRANTIKLVRLKGSSSYKDFRDDSNRN